MGPTGELKEKMGKIFFGDRSEGLVKGGRCQQYLSEVRGVCEVGEWAGRAWGGGFMGTGTQGREEAYRVRLRPMLCTRPGW